MQPLSAHEQALQEKAKNYDLEDDLRKAWEGSTKSAFKDLPRLAKRTKVESAGTVVIRDGRMVTCDHDRKEIRRLRRKNRKTLEKMDTLLKSLVPTDNKPDKSLWDDEQDQEENNQDGDENQEEETRDLEDEDGQAIDNTEADGENDSSVDPLLNNPFQESTSSKSSSSKEKNGADDINENKNDIVLNGKKGEEEAGAGADEKKNADSEDEKDVELPPITVWQAICNVLNTLTSFLEENDVHKKVKERLHELSQEINETSDYETILQDLFENDFSKESRTFKVLKAVTQNMIFPSMYKLKVSLFKGIQMRDVRTSDGWKVIIDLSDAISVTHRRWMQSQEPEDSEKYYKIQWEIKLSFDDKVSDLKAAMLRTLKVHCSPKMSTTEQVRLQSYFFGGHVIL